LSLDAQPEFFLLPNLSQAWAQDIYLLVFGQAVRNGQVHECLMLIDQLGDASTGRGLSWKPKSSARASAETVLDQIRHTRWAATEDDPMAMAIKARLKWYSKPASAPGP
jgi:hypothetical protein